jgi:glycosyltransferase involved in cell wall biosynthesis
MILSAKPEIGTGYSTVVQNLAPEFKKMGYNVAITAFQQSYYKEQYKGIDVYPLNTDFHSVGNIGAQIHSLVLNMRAHQSDALLCLFQGDSMYNAFTQVHPKTIWYVPIEGQIVYKNHPLFTAARKVKKVASMTHSAGKQLSDNEIPNVTIYHGYNPKTFKKGYNKTLTEPINLYFPLNNEEIIIPANKLSELKERMGVNCMFGFAGLNLGTRKRIERLLESFALFKKGGHRDAHLHLHTPPIHTKGLNLLEIIDYYNIKDSVTFSYSNIGTGSLSEQAMNNIYNLFDIYISASSGEGFGLPILETAALGIPQIHPDFQPFREFIGDGTEKRGLLAECTPQMTVAGEFRALVNTRDLAEKMELLYTDVDLRKTLGNSAEKWAAPLTWDRIARQFDTVFKET